MGTLKKSAKAIVVGAGLAAAVATTVTLATVSLTKRMVEVALKRSAPAKIPQMGRAKTKLRGFEDSEAFMEAIRLGEEALREKDLPTVGITTEDGLELVGHWYEAESPKRVVIAMHGWRSSWARDFGTIAEEWHEDGCHVLFVEQRGQGDSGGEYMGFGMMERHDCLQWVQFVNEHLAGDLPIYLAGVSMGAATVLMASELDLPPNVHGIVADCGFTSPHAIWKHVVENNLHLHYGLLGRIADDVCKKHIQMGPKDVSASEALRNTTVPVLFIHGTDDHFVPVTMTYENYKACASAKSLLVVPGADHGMSHFVDPEGYRRTVRDFWASFDAVSPPPRVCKDESEGAEEQIE